MKISISIFLLLSAFLLHAEEIDQSVINQISEYDLTQKEIEFHDKYHGLFPLIIQDLKNCAPAADSSQIDTYSQYVVSYGKYLETTDISDYNKVTIHNPLYWKACFALISRDATVLYTRLFFLMREGFLKRAEILLLFAYYNSNPDWERDSIIFDGVNSDLQYIYDKSSTLIEQGIEYFDSGQKQKAMEFYRQALTVYPKSPWALYEIALTKRLNDIANTEAVDPYFTLIRAYDPFYMHAYQGKITPFLRKAAIALLESIQPSYQELWKGDMTLENLRSFAEGLKTLEEYEFAIYAYRLLLVQSFDGSFNRDIADEIIFCLKMLGHKDMKDFLYTLLSDFEAKIAEQE
jgi:tetratricopeptide (TPR) repeat protein